jgi:hypothetical protein
LSLISQYKQSIEKHSEAVKENRKIVGQCRLVLTIPATSAADERSFSALKRIEIYLRNSQNQDRLSSLALMNIEKSFLNTLQSKPSLLDEVIDLLAMKNRRIELNYKQ